jgi:hypothetical protein
LAIGAITKTELSTTSVEDAIRAIPNEERACASPDENATILGLVDLDLFGEVHDDKRATIAIRDVKHLSIDATWLREERAVKRGRRREIETSLIKGCGSFFFPLNE